jgi:hypothetical protein
MRPLPRAVTWMTERFLEPPLNSTAGQIDFARRFYQMVRAARAGVPPPFRLSLSDELAKQLNRGGEVRIKSLRGATEALARFPVFGIYAVDFDPSEEFDDFSLAKQYPKAGYVRWVQLGATVGMEGWRADIVLKNELVVRVHLQRELIPPF